MSSQHPVTVNTGVGSPSGWRQPCLLEPGPHSWVVFLWLHTGQKVIPMLPPSEWTFLENSSNNILSSAFGKEPKPRQGKGFACRWFHVQFLELPIKMFSAGSWWERTSQRVTIDLSRQWCLSPSPIDRFMLTHKHSSMCIIKTVHLLYEIAQWKVWRTLRHCFQKLAWCCSIVFSTHKY